MDRIYKLQGKVYFFNDKASSEDDFRYDPYEARLDRTWTRYELEELILKKIMLAESYFRAGVKVEIKEIKNQIDVINRELDEMRETIWA